MAKSTTKAMNRDDIQWLMDQSLLANRTNLQGLFGGWQWTQDDNGNWTQTQSVNDALLPGIQNLVNSATSQQGYQGPEQFGTMLNALMNKRVQALGQDPGYSPTQPMQTQYGSTAYTPPQIPNNSFNPSGSQAAPMMGNAGGLSSTPEGRSRGAISNARERADSGMYGEFGQGGGDMQWLMNLIGGGSGGSPTDSGLNLFGDKENGSLSRLWAAENGGNIGRGAGALIGALLGVPGLSKAGQALGKYFGNKTLDNYNWMSPTDTQSSTQDALDSYFGTTREPLPRSEMPDTRRMPAGFGYASYDPAGSITGGGAFRYPTRLTPRPTGYVG